VFRLQIESECWRDVTGFLPGAGWGGALLGLDSMVWVLVPSLEKLLGLDDLLNVRFFCHA